MPDVQQQTLTATARHEGEPVRGSRFIGTAAPMADPAELDGLIDALRAEFPAATHHAFGWRCGPRGARSRASDDGEPGGTAGRPILQRLESRGLTDAAVIVTRIFGGTKLGAGGLIRAYGGAAGMVLDRAPTRPLVLTARIRLRVPYDAVGAVERLLAAEGLSAVDSEYGGDVRLAVDVPQATVAALIARLGDVSRGRVSTERDDGDDGG